MKALIKTLFGDGPNVAFVAIVLAVEGLLVYGGHPADAAVAVPVIVLGGVAWLATR